jgi:hypothetical protein
MALTTTVVVDDEQTDRFTISSTDDEEKGRKGELLPVHPVLCFYMSTALYPVSRTSQKYKEAFSGTENTHS